MPANAQAIKPIAPAIVATQTETKAYDFAKQYLAEQIFRDAEQQLGKKVDSRFRAQVMKNLLSKSSEDLAKLRADSNALNPIVEMLGGSFKDFTYTPLSTPCRVFDSRAASGYQGQGTGPLAAGTAVHLYITDTVPVTNCGIPWPDTRAVVINVVAASPTGVGNLREWPYDSTNPPAPNAAILNYTTGQNLANGVVVPICNVATATAGSCYTADIFIEPFNHSTDVVIDALGYFAPTAATPLETANQSVTFDAAPQTYMSATTPDCPAGYTLTGGGEVRTSSTYTNDDTLFDSGQIGNHWYCAGWNNAASGGLHWAGVCTAFCTRIP